MDPSDRKFVAFALAGGAGGAGADGCRVPNAVDTGWWVIGEWLGGTGVGSARLLLPVPLASRPEFEADLASFVEAPALGAPGMW